MYSNSCSVCKQHDQLMHLVLHLLLPPLLLLPLLTWQNSASLVLTDSSSGASQRQASRLGLRPKERSTCGAGGRGMARVSTEC